MNRSKCKWSAAGIDARNLAAFRRSYPEGGNWVVTSDTRRAYERTDRGLTVTVTGLPGLTDLLAGYGRG